MSQKVKNPNYKGKWKTPWIDNPGNECMHLNTLANDMKFCHTIRNSFWSPALSLSLSSEFEDDPDLYVLRPTKYVGIEIWQVRIVVWTSIMLSFHNLWS